MAFGAVRWIKRSAPGRLGLLPRPNSSAWFETHIDQLKGSGLDKVVSLLTDKEVHDLELEGEQAILERNGIEFERYPIEDKTTPPLDDKMTTFFRRLLSELHAGKSLAAHCHSGRGRTTLLIASLLALEGMHPDKAIRKVGWTRLLPVPDKEEQTEWVRSFAAKENPASLEGDPGTVVAVRDRAILGIGVAAVFAVGVVAFLGWRRRSA